MHYVTYAKLLDDVLAWERSLPPFDIAIGVPRSGLIPASLLALRRNVPMSDLAAFLVDPHEVYATCYLRDNNPAKLKPRCNRILIIDDACSSDSVTFKHIRRKLRGVTLPEMIKIEYAAVYRASIRSELDYCYREIPQPRIFEWNWFRHSFLSKFLLDMDGVICEDWKGEEQDGDDPVYQAHLANAKPLFVPERPVAGIVTSRLMKHRQATEAWLKRHNVRYAELVMHPAETPSARRRACDYAIRKSRVYTERGALLFVESSAGQARDIFHITGKPVLCVDANHLFKAETMGGKNC